MVMNVRVVLIRLLGRLGAYRGFFAVCGFAVVGATGAAAFALVGLIQVSQVAAAVAILATLGALSLQVYAWRRRARGLQKRLEGMEQRYEKFIGTHEARMSEAVAAAAFEVRIIDALFRCRMWGLGVYNKLPDLDAGLGHAVAGRLSDEGDVLTAFELLRKDRSLGGLASPSLRDLRRELRLRGYLRSTEEVARELVSRSSDASDRRALVRVEAEIAVLTGSHTPNSPRLTPISNPVPGRILHVVGKSLPAHQTGYTIRTHQIAKSQARLGFDVHVVTQSGFGASQGEKLSPTDIEGVSYHRLAGPSTQDVPLSDWLDQHCERLGELVGQLRPSVLHAASNFINAMASQSVGRAANLPVIYESRGFWEESWLSRQAANYGWSDLVNLSERHGLPDNYVWRRDLEDRLRAEADHVVTLDDQMQDRICQGGTPPENVTVIPNAVDPDDFPVPERDELLAVDMGIGPETLVIGYISSLNEYEGIDDLITAFGQVQRSRPDIDIQLLIVGDGDARAALESQVDDLKLVGATFTGRVPHADVLRYYSLIDIFVVPRKPVEVCHLVTPLKPYEALATERTVVLSNVRALASIARQSGAVELFEAGDPDSLAVVLRELIDSPERRLELSTRGRRWVHSNHTWASNASAYAEIYASLTAKMTQA